MSRMTLLTGPECRRRWDDDVKEQILADAFSPGATVDWTATAKIGWSPSARKWFITDVRRWRESPAEVERLIKRVAEEDAADGCWVKIMIPQDPGQAGKSQSQALLRMLAGALQCRAGIAPPQS